MSFTSKGERMILTKTSVGPIQGGKYHTLTVRHDSPAERVDGWPKRNIFKKYYTGEHIFSLKYCGNTS